MTLFKSKSTLWLYVISLIAYLVLYISIWVFSMLQNIHSAVITSAFFLLLLQVFVLFHAFRSKLLTITSLSLFILVLIEALNFRIQGIPQQDGFLRFDWFYHIVFTMLIVLMSIGVYHEILRHQKLHQIQTASYEQHEAIFIEYIKKGQKIRIEFSKFFMTRYGLPVHLLILKLHEFKTYLHPEDSDVIQNFDDFIVQNQAFDAKIRVKFPLMTDFATLILKGSFQLEHRYICIGFDVTQLEKTQQELHMRRSLYDHLEVESRKIIKNTGSYISKMKPDGTIVFASDALVRLYDIEYGMIVGQNALKLSEKQGYFDHSWFYQALKKGKSQGTGTIRSKSKVTHISWKNDVLYDQKGNVEFLITVGNDITDMVMLNQRLEYQSTHDALTGLLNHRGLLQSLEDMKHDIKQAVSFFIDVKDLSHARDYYGNEIGDFILTKIADELNTFGKGKHLVSRYYGDQFVIICTNPEPGELERCMQRLKESMLQIYHIEHAHMQIKKHIGYAIYKEHTQHLLQIIHLSSLAMKHSQQSVHNDIVKYSKEMSEELNTNIHLAYQLHEAITQAKIDVYFQKIVDARTSQVLYVEALARWIDPKMGFVSPDTFFSVATKSNLVDQLDEYLVHLAIRKFAELKEKENYQHVKLSLNLTPSSFLRDEFSEHVLNFAHEYKIMPSDIVIEISENTFVNNLDMCAYYMDTYKQCGFNIAIDDFGSQYSSLAILERLNYDIIKIDGAFVIHLASTKNQAIISMIETIASLEKKQMIAESVETKEISQLLLQFNCTTQQGYFFHKPEKLI